MTGGALLVYGANGYTGELVARRAAARGLAPILAGRRRSPVAALAGELGLPAGSAELDDRDALAGLLDGVSTVLHCAGPFVRTSRPMVEACLERRCHYLDITGEIAVFESVLADDARARAAGVALVPGVGFDVVPSDGLAARLARGLPSATHLDLAFVADGGHWSPGTVKTMIESLPAAGAVRREGRIVPVPPAWDMREIEFEGGPRTVVSIPWGDVSTAYHTTGIPNVRVYAGMPPGEVGRLRRLAPFLRLAGLRPVKSLLQWWVGRRVHGPDEATRERARMLLWGRAWNDEGDAVEATAITPEGYAFTAASAVECARRVAGGEVAPGAWTPARAFGADFAAEIPGVVLGEVKRISRAG